MISISEVLLGQGRFQKYHLYEPKGQNQNKLLGKKGCLLSAKISEGR